jgi:hypothetical protein
VDKLVNVKGTYLDSYLNDERYKDQWVLLSSPNTQGELKGHKLCGFLADDNIRDGASLSTSDSALDGLANIVGSVGGTGKLGQAMNTAEGTLTNLNKVVSDLIIYEGVDNSSRTVNMIVVPQTKGNGTMEDIISYLNKCTRPKPYSIVGEKINPLKFSSYLPELNKTNVLENQKDEIGGTLLNIKDKVKSVITGGESRDILPKLVWSKEYMQLNIGDNVKMTGMVLMDYEIEWDLLRGEDGQFWYAKISLGLAPYRTPDALIASDWFTHVNSWEIN